MQTRGRVTASVAAELDRHAERAAAEVAARVPEYERALRAAGEDPRAAGEGALALFLAVIDNRRALAGAARSIRRVAAGRCEAGVALDTLIEAVSAQRDVLRQALEAAAVPLGPPHAERALLDLERRLDAAVTGTIAEVARGYMAAVTERSRRQQESMAALVRVASAVNRSVEVGEVAAAALAAIAEALGVDAAALWTPAEDSPEVVLAYTHGFRWDEDRDLRAPGAGLPRLVARAARGASAVNGSPLTAGETVVLEGAAAVGLRSRGELCGVLAAGDRRARAFTEAELRFLTSAGDQVAAAIVRSSQHRREARTDGLTGLANRKELERQLQSAIATSRRHARALTLVLADLDGLKAINDTQGHAAGDGALRSVAAALLATVRSTDLCARIGGDEFAIVLPDTPSAVAAEVMKRVEQRLADSGLRLSYGIAGWEPRLSGYMLFKLADNRLYREKRRHHRIDEESGLGA